jgi:LemA protein
MKFVRACVLLLLVVGLSGCGYNAIQRQVEAV